MQRPDEATRYRRYLELLASVDPGTSSEGRWWNMVESLFTQITFDLPGSATFSLHEVVGENVIYRHGGPEGRKHLRTRTQPTHRKLGRIGSALLSQQPFDITADVKKFKRGQDYVEGRPDTRSELVIPIRGPQALPLGVINIETDIPDAFDHIDGNAIACLAAWLGIVIAGAGNPVVAEVEVLRLLKRQLDGVRSAVSDAEKQQLLFANTLQLINAILPFRAAGVVTAVNSAPHHLYLNIEFLKEMSLSPEKMAQFRTRPDTFSSAIIRNCLEKPNDIIIRTYDVNDPGPERFPIQEFRPKTAYTVGVGLTYQTTERRQLAILLDFDQRVDFGPGASDALRNAASCLRSLLSLVEDDRLATKRKQIVEGAIARSADLRDIKKTSHYEFGSRCMEAVRKAIHASGCGIFFLRNEVLDSHAYEGVGNNVYWSAELTKQLHQLEPARTRDEEVEFMHSPSDGGEFIVFAKRIRLFSEGLFVSIKDVSGRPELRGMSTTTREIVRDFLPVIEFASRERCAFGELQWVSDALATSLKQQLRNLRKRGSIVAAVHGFFEEWEPVRNPYCAIFEVRSDPDDREIGLAMTKESLKYIMAKAHPSRFSKIHQAPLSFDFEAHGKSLTVQAWRQGELFCESVEGAPHCTEWWDGITGVGPQSRMFAGAAIVRRSKEGQAERLGVLTLNGPRSETAVMHPEQMRGILTVVRAAAEGLGEALGNSND